MLKPVAVTSSVSPVHRSRGTRTLASPAVFHRFLMRPRTFLVAVKHNAMKNPVKQDFMIKYEPLDETNDLQNCYMTERTTSL